MDVGEKRTTSLKITPPNPSQSTGRILGSGNEMTERESRPDHNTQYPNSTSGQKGPCSLSTNVGLSTVFQGLTTNIS